MKYSYNIPFKKDQLGIESLIENDRVIPRNSLQTDPPSIGKLISTLLVAIYFLSIWSPPFIPIIEPRWYLVLVITLFAFLLQKKTFNMNSASLYWLVSGISFLGAVVSLINANDLTLSLWNTVAMGVNILALLLLIPILANQNARRFLLVLLVCVALLWVLKIQELVRTHNTLFYSTFAETGENKNHVAFLLALASTTLIYCAVFWKPFKSQAKVRLFALRLCLILAAFFLFYNQSLIYARSGMLTTLVGIMVVFIAMFQKSSKKLFTAFIIAFLVVMFTISVSLVIPKVLETSPYWENMYLRMFNETEAFYSREILLQKGLYIISQNPFLGIGLGGTRAPIFSSYGDFPGYLLHNTFLTDWAEKGILGLLSNVIWILAYLKILKNNLFSRPLVDQIWLILLIPLFFEMNFKEINTISMMLLVILTAIVYDQKTVRRNLSFSHLNFTKS